MDWDSYSYLHVYAPHAPQHPSFIIGNRQALTDLCRLIDQALRKDTANKGFFPSDNEGYDVYVGVVKNQMIFRSLEMPYTNQFGEANQQFHFINIQNDPSAPYSPGTLFENRYKSVDKQHNTSWADNNYLQMYASYTHHHEVFIIGNKQALTTLCKLIDQALTEDQAVDDFFASDDQGYNVCVAVIAEEAIFQSLEMPYTEQFGEINLYLYYAKLNDKTQPPYSPVILFPE
ncbi:hypothetical protein [Gracilibacillus alcaliphilus]|uniref:hypothetical protein n=1 Tax=Gracilibacillus alcaliphilus TaxID=1401441 RepID=UPI00195636EF|nr:hypothetical protein [Gracilibacillus alcaliphilus]MBM7679435.1 hypothetical protein [Gracilibacillus alcaliphilus]